METSRSEERSIASNVNPAPTDEEAAAIAAAIGEYLLEEAAAMAAQEGDTGERTWDGRRWRFAGRLERMGTAAVRVPEGAPADSWTTASRLERLQR